MGSGKLQGTRDGRALGVVGADWGGRTRGGGCGGVDGAHGRASGVRVGTARKSGTHARFAAEVATVLKAEFLLGACWCNPITPAPTV